MTRVSVAERARLTGFIMHRGLRRLAVQLNRRPALPWPFVRSKADRLVIAPQDLRTADATRATEIYAGRFAFAGKVVVCDARSPFEIASPSDEWAASLLGFGWLRHLRAAESGITRANSRALVDEWITLQGTLDPIAWRPDVTARRIISWLSQAPLVLHDADLQFYRRFLRSLCKQVRYLRRAAADAPDGMPRFQTVIALTYAALCISSQIRHIKVATKKLVEEIERQVLLDGGHVSRNPEALVELLLDLLPLRQAFTARNIPPPQQLFTAIDRMMPMLRFFRHGDGSFALFNGCGPIAQDALVTVLAYDDARGTPVANAAYSGYQRLETAGALLIVDTGAPPPIAISTEAHAGCLSFEFSAGLDRIVVNCGMPAIGREVWRQVARSTAAHSTLTYNDSSSCRFVESASIKRFLKAAPMLDGPAAIDVTREERDDVLALRASHDGYASRYGIIHERSLALAADGERLDGEDHIAPAGGAALPADGPDAFAVRFHLHPTVKANRLSDGRGAVLMLPSRDVWTFNAYDHQVEIEESVFLAGREGPRRTVQIVIYGNARTTPRVQWSLAHVTPAVAAARRAAHEEPELPL